MSGRVLNDVRYCVWIAFEVTFVYFMFPETSGRTLEELTFCKSALCVIYLQSSYGYLDSV